MPHVAEAATKDEEKLRRNCRWAISAFVCPYSTRTFYHLRQTYAALCMQSHMGLLLEIVWETVHVLTKAVSD